MILLIFTIVVVSAGAIMALLVNLVLPRHFSDERYYREMPYYTPEEARYFRYVPYLDELNKGRLEGQIENYPWLVSLSILKHKEEPRSTEFRCTGIAIDVHLVLSGESCSDGMLGKSYVASDFRIRKKTNYFYKRGKSRLANTLSKVDPEDDVYSHMYLFTTHLKFEDISPFASKKFEGDNAAEAKLAAVGWGGPLVATKDVSARYGFFIDMWSTKNMCNERDNCRHSVEHENIRPQDINENDTCCQEGILYFDANATKGSLTGKPLINLADGKIVGMQYDVKVNSEPDFGFTTVFVPLSEEDMNNVLTSNNEKKYQPSSKSVLLFRRTFKRTYLRSWLRHRVPVQKSTECNATASRTEDPIQVFTKP